MTYRPLFADDNNEKWAQQRERRSRLRDLREWWSMEWSFWTFFAVMLGLVGGLVCLFAWLDDNDDQQFAQDCAQRSFTASQCEMLLSEHRKTRDAEMAVGFAIGLAASQVGRSR
jgi:hypothetical protein